MSNGAHINWDHAWMAANWKVMQDEEIAEKMDVSRDAVKGYRLRHGWKRETQRRRCGGSPMKNVQAAIDEALIRGMELCITRVLIGSRYQMLLSASLTTSGRVLKCGPKMVLGISQLPKVLHEVNEDFARMKRRAAA